MRMELLPRCKGYGFVDANRPEDAACLCLSIAGFHFFNSGQKRTQARCCVAGSHSYRRVGGPLWSQVPPRV